MPAGPHHLGNTDLATASLEDVERLFTRDGRAWREIEDRLPPQVRTPMAARRSLRRIASAIRRHAQDWPEHGWDPETETTAGRRNRMAATAFGWHHGHRDGQPGWYFFPGLAAGAATPDDAQDAARGPTPRMAENLQRSLDQLTAITAASQVTIDWATPTTLRTTLLAMHDATALPHDRATAGYEPGAWRRIEHRHIPASLPEARAMPELMDDLHREVRRTDTAEAQVWIARIGLGLIHPANAGHGTSRTSRTIEALSESMGRTRATRPPLITLRERMAMDQARAALIRYGWVKPILQVIDHCRAHDQAGHPYDDWRALRTALKDLQEAREYPITRGPARHPPDWEWNA